MPSAESGGTGNFWYSFDYGMTHFVQFDTETDLGHGLIAPDSPQGGTEDSGPFALANAQANWLAADLAKVDRAKTPWVVGMFNHPTILNDLLTSLLSRGSQALVQQRINLHYLPRSFRVIFISERSGLGEIPPLRLTNR